MILPQPLHSSQPRNRPGVRSGLRGRAWFPFLALGGCCAGLLLAAPVQPSTSTAAAATPVSPAATGATAEAASGVVSYQGRLTDGGFPTSGSYDFQFLLKDAASAGNTVGEPLIMTLQVQNGVFSASLPWKPALFDGAPRWVEVQVRPTAAAGSTTGSTSGAAAPYAVLERQRIFSAPYSYRSQSAVTVDSVPEKSLPASVPLKGTDGKLDSGLLAADIARSAQVAALGDSVKALETRLTALAAENASLKQSVQVLSAPARSGWMAASGQPDDASLIAAGFSMVTSVPAPTWALINGTRSPSPRFGAVGVWTGREWMIWGGKISSQGVTGSGAAFRPDLNQWTSISTLDAPDARGGHTLVWTGTEMIVWGGFANGPIRSGARYTPAPQRWIPVSIDTSTPSARSGHSAVWTGSSMVVFGGKNTAGLLGDGAAYDPISDHWTVLPTSGAPTARAGATAVWTGTSVLIWGGEGDVSSVSSGALLNFSQDGKPAAWKSISTQSAPSSRSGHASAWDGQRLFVWGGRSRSGGLLSDGAVWDSTTDSWSPLATKGAPTACVFPVAAWTGEEFVIFSGAGLQGVLASGAAWNPATSTWRALPGLDPTLARQGAISAWTGSQFLIFGGQSTSGGPMGDAQSLDVRPPWYLYRRSALPTATLPQTSP